MSLKIIQEEKLNNPILILSFYGWSDAGYAASSAIRYLIKDSNAHKIAKIDSNNFMNFSQTRPKVLMKNNKRQIQWPDSSFYAIKRPNHKNDLLVFLGHEPNFMWNDFFNVAYEFCQKQEIIAAISLGALLAEVSHKDDTKIFGNSNNPILTDDIIFPLATTNVYEGPTGMMGLFTGNLVTEALPHGSIWANIPYYLNSITNPKATEAILKQLDMILTLELNLDEINKLSSKFNNYLEGILKSHPDITKINDKLELLKNLPNSDDIISDLEDYYNELFDGE
ncbi:MAG: PAC2 family protein [Dehalococcoidia bacterium]|nr:PAC2 family protein [Dehalococcoidia bacterium]